MKPEKLKVIAVGMGYRVSHYANEDLIADRPSGGVCIYEPLTNAEQCMEIMERLKLNVLHHHACGDYNDVRVVLPSGDFVEGKTINEAACNAAYEYFKGE